MKILALLFIFITLTYCSEECYHLIIDWIDNLRSLNLIDPIMYANSGKFLNDYGDYKNCQFHKGQYVYFTMQVLNRLGGNIQYMGLCAPISCESEIASNIYAPIIQEKLNTAFQNAANTTFVPFLNLKIYNPAEAEPKMDWSNYLVIGLIVTLILIGIIGSIISKITQSQSKPVKVLQAFSIYDNLAKIFAIPKEVENQNLLFLNGVRTLSIFWIIFSHTAWYHWLNLRNWMDLFDIFTSSEMMTIGTAGYFAVDTFFWIGGFLITLGMIEQLKKVKKFYNFYFGAIIHRLIRIWPTYMLAILFYWKIMPFLGSGPAWSAYTQNASACDKKIYQNMLFFNNFVSQKSFSEYCFGWSWYLAADFQLFLITPFLIYTYHKNKKLGWIVSISLFLACIVFVFTQVISNKWRYPLPQKNLPPQPNILDKFYYKPWTHASAYIMGIFSGFIYVEWKNGDATIVKYVNKIKQSILIRCLFYVIGIGLCETVIWIVVPYQRGEIWSTLTHAFYNSLNRVFFLIGVYLCVFAAMFGCKNDPSRIILGHWIFSPLAKVSFCTYLVHYMVIQNEVYSSNVQIIWKTSTIIYYTIMDIFLSIVMATALSCIIQAPILGLEKILLHRGVKKIPVQNQNQKKQMVKENCHDEDEITTREELSSQEIEIDDLINPQKEQKTIIS